MTDICKPKLSFWSWGHHICPIITKENIFLKVNNGSQAQRLLAVTKMLFSTEGKQWKQDVLIYFVCYCLYATTCNPKLRLMKHFLSSQLPGLLVLPMLAFIPCPFIQQTLTHLRRGRGGERNMWMEAFLSMVEVCRIPETSQLRQNTKSPFALQSSGMHRLHWKRW